MDIAKTDLVDRVRQKVRDKWGGDPEPEIEIATAIDSSFPDMLVDVEGALPGSVITNIKSNLDVNMAYTAWEVKINSGINRDWSITCKIPDVAFAGSSPEEIKKTMPKILTDAIIAQVTSRMRVDLEYQITKLLNPELKSGYMAVGDGKFVPVWGTEDDK